MLQRPWFSSLQPLRIQSFGAAESHAEKIRCRDTLKRIVVRSPGLIAEADCAPQ